MVVQQTEVEGNLDEEIKTRLFNNKVFLKSKCLCCVLLSVDVLFATSGKGASKIIFQLG